MQVQIQQLAPGMIQQIQTVCSECRGQREIIDPKDRCKLCQVIIHETRYDDILNYLTEI